MRLSQFENKNSTSQKEDDIINKYNELKDLPQDELSRRLLSEVEKQKREGTFNYAQLSSNVEMMKGFVPKSTYENMKRILDSLK